MRWTIVDEMNEMDCGLKEIKMKHDQWSVDWRKWDETWTMKCVLKEMRKNMNNEVNNVTLPNLISMLLVSFFSDQTVHCVDTVFI